ncbi:MAG: hypothetical protein JO211_17465 [Acidobacteriaceae bacterium]|nr:hypothetical protein [Acidobacteriaceae bacterium]
MALGYAVDVLGFRGRSIVTRMALGLLLSLAVCPILVYLLARFGGFRAVWVFYAAVWFIAAVMGWRERRAFAPAVRELFSSHRVGLALVFGWIVFCALWEVDFVTASNVFRPLNTMDAIAHVAFTNALTRTGIPPNNPFLYPGSPLPLFYYYVWYLVCSLVDQIGGSVVTSRAAVQAGTVWVGLAVAALVMVYTEIISPYIVTGIRKFRFGVAIALLTVTGLDLIPYSFLFFAKVFLDKGTGAGASIEWWNEQVTAWLGAILMSPHHPIAMVICFTAIALWSSLSNGALTRTQKVLLIALLGLAFASACAISAYVMVAFSAGVLLWAIFAMRHGWWPSLLPLCAAAILAGLLYAPFALELRAASHETKLPVTLTVRAFTPVDYWLPSILKFLKHSPGAIYLLRLLFLPLNYFAELGFFLVAAWIYWRWRLSLSRPLGQVESMLACAALGSVLVCTFLASTFRWNDLGWRGFLIAQFVLLLWATPISESLIRPGDSEVILPRRWRLLTWFCLAVGVAGTCVEMMNMRLRVDGPRGPQTVASREAYIWIDQHTPQNTVVLFDPNVYLEYFNSLYGHRQAVSAGQAYGTFFSSGGIGQRILGDATDFFSRDETPDQIRSMCARYHVGAIVVQASDPVWNDRSSWIWKANPSYSNEMVRVFTSQDLKVYAAE